MRNVDITTEEAQDTDRSRAIIRGRPNWLCFCLEKPLEYETLSGVHSEIPSAEGDGTPALPICPHESGWTSLQT